MVDRFRVVGCRRHDTSIGRHSSEVGNVPSLDLYQIHVSLGFAGCDCIQNDGSERRPISNHRYVA